MGSDGALWRHKMKLKTNIYPARGGNEIVLSILIYNIISHYHDGSFCAYLLTALCTLEPVSADNRVHCVQECLSFF